MKYRIEIAELADHYVVAAKDKETGDPVEVFTLNESGVEMLKLFSEGLDASAVARSISERYDVPISLVLPDVLAFAEELKQKGMM